MNVHVRDYNKTYRLDSLGLAIAFLFFFSIVHNHCAVSIHLLFLLNCKLSVNNKHMLKREKALLAIPFFALFFTGC